MKDITSRVSGKSADGAAEEIWISKFDLDYAYCHIQPLQSHIPSGTREQSTKLWTAITR